MAEGDKVIPHYYTIHLVLSIIRRHQVNKCVCIPRTDEMTHMISTSSGRDGVRLAHHISEASMVIQGHLKNLLFADLSLSMTTLITIFAFCLQSGK